MDMPFAWFPRDRFVQGRYERIANSCWELEYMELVRKECLPVIEEAYLRAATNNLSMAMTALHGLEILGSEGWEEREMLTIHVRPHRGNHASYIYQRLGSSSAQRRTTSENPRSVKRLCIDVPNSDPLRQVYRSEIIYLY